MNNDFRINELYTNANICRHCQKPMLRSLRVCPHCNELSYGSEEDSRKYRNYKNILYYFNIFTAVSVIIITFLFIASMLLEFNKTEVRDKTFSEYSQTLSYNEEVYADIVYACEIAEISTYFGSYKTQIDPTLKSVYFLGFKDYYSVIDFLLAEDYTSLEVDSDKFLMIEASSYYADDLNALFEEGVLSEEPLRIYGTIVKTPGNNVDTTNPTNDYKKTPSDIDGLIDDYLYSAEENREVLEFINKFKVLEFNPEMEMTYTATIGIGPGGYCLIGAFSFILIAVCLLCAKKFITNKMKRFVRSISNDYII